MNKNKEVEMWKLVEDLIDEGGTLYKEEMLLDIKTFLEAVRDNNTSCVQFMATTMAIKFKKISEDGGRLI